MPLVGRGVEDALESVGMGLVPVLFLADAVEAIKQVKIARGGHMGADRG